MDYNKLQPTALASISKATTALTAANACRKRSTLSLPTMRCPANMAMIAPMPKGNAISQRMEPCSVAAAMPLTDT